ncbi:MAG: FtsQ-type POTRA domain-containing protein [Gomphosphaeria aponina SAG 52.96 = DSM 107014]|uniref:FtsQ-type POTRA domain-containing protein n=1 Tax=Gomphosphaeria aponina SAG 52.96 = DSM 107014 TaxID=1521640 RepID=A0A941JUY7_9CHRO|nr:FtsQ-type POTRA domain-containing protein [Gomphosphaeria aponina SAG 52.96 = DSM 107014]
MASLSAVSSAQKEKKRRAYWQRKRWLKYWQGVGRSLSIASIAGGLFWLVTLPNWMIRSESQIDLESQQYLSKDELVSLLPWEQPQYIFKINPEKLSAYLKSTAPIAEATVERQLFPPKLKFRVQELDLVAIVYRENKEVGSVDQKGKFIARKFYRGDKNLELPSIKLLEFNEESGAYWQEMYPLLMNYSVKISEIDWQDPSNMILKTEMGNVSLGPYTSQEKLARQLEVLGEIYSSKEQLDTSKIILLDLSNPESPAIKIKQKEAKEN